MLVVELKVKEDVKDRLYLTLIEQSDRKREVRQMGTLLNAPECLPTLLDAGMSNLSMCKTPSFLSICIPVMFPLGFPIMTWVDRYTRPQRVDAGQVSNTKHKISTCSTRPYTTRC